MDARGNRIALIDVGSNSVHMCIYQTDGKGFEKVVDVRDYARLGLHIGDEGMLSDQGIAAGGKAIQKMVRLAAEEGSDQVHAFATAAVRNCANSAEAVAAMEQVAGCSIRVLSGEDEARLSAAGALQSAAMTSGLFFDLGGGSTELSVVADGKLVAWDSLPVGALSVWRNSDDRTLPSVEVIAAIEQRFVALLQASSVDVTGRANVCGVGGTVRLALSVAQADDAPDSGRTLHATDLDAILELASQVPDVLAETIQSIKPELVRAFVPGCIMMRAILRQSGCSSLEVAQTSLREGFLVEEVLAD